MTEHVDYNLNNIFEFIWKNRRILTIVTIAGAIISIVISILLPNKYKSETYLFATSFVAPSTMSESINQETDPLKIGDEDDLERTIQILNSREITDRIIQKYDLGKHYKIKETSPYYKTLTRKEFESNVSYDKTSYQGIRISVIDKDPKLSATIANDISYMLDSLVMNMQLQRAKETYNLALNEFKKETEYIRSFEDSIDIYRQLGIIDFDKDLDRYTEAYAKALGRNTLTSHAKSIFENKFELYRKYAKPWRSLQKKIDIESDNAQRLHLRVIQMEQNMNQPISHKFTISTAKAPEKKEYPKRSLIVLLSTLSAFLFTLGLMLILQYFRRLRLSFGTNS